MLRRVALATPLILGLAGSVGAQQTTTNVPPYTDAQAAAAASSLMTSFTSPNLQMPNGANVAHTIYIATSSATINGMSDATCFGSSGCGSQTILPVAMFVGARFHVQCAGTYSTGLATVATLTVKLKWGATTIATVTTPALPSSIAGLSFFLDETCTIRSTGASGSIVCTRGVSYTTAAGIAAIFNGLVTSSPVTIDTTVSTKIDATGAFSSLIGSPSATAVEASIVQEN